MRSDKFPDKNSPFRAALIPSCMGCMFGELIMPVDMLVILAFDARRVRSEAWARWAALK